MKPFLAFRYDLYYPVGGMNDFVGDFDSFAEAEAALVKARGDVQHILDLTDGAISERSTIGWSENYNDWKTEPLKG